MQREDGFRRINAVTTWVAAGSLAAVAAVAALVGHEIPGRSDTSTTTKTNTNTGSSATRSTSVRARHDRGLSAPDRLPSSGSGSGSTVSGAT